MRNCPQCDTAAERNAQLVVGIRKVIAEVHRLEHNPQGRYTEMHWWQCERMPCRGVRLVLDVQPGNRKAAD